MLLYSSDVTGYAAVRQGELDAYAYDRIMMEFAIAGGVEGVRLLEGSLGETMDIAVGISPKTEIPNLTQKVNQFLRELRDEGTPIMLLGHVLVCAAYLLLVCIRKRVALPVFVKKVAPTFLIGLSTASSAAAYSTNVECCEKQLGIDRQIINFGIPLGQWPSPLP